MIGNLQGRRTAGIRYRDDHVNVVVTELPDDLAGQLLTHTEACLVDGQVVQNRIGPGEIDVFEYAVLRR